MDYYDFMELVAYFLKPKVYVELGLYDGQTFSKMIPHATQCFGVDIKPNKNLQQLENKYPDKIKIIYDTTDNFFLTFNEKIDIAFIDADHHFESALKDFENVLKLLNDDGIIFMHDTDPITNKYMDQQLCGDSYKIVPLLEKRNDINIITIPITVAGLSIIMKKNSSRTFLRNGNSVY